MSVLKFSNSKMLTQAVSSFQPLRECGCGVCYQAIPMFARYHESGDEFRGYYWNCEGCNSTLFVSSPRGRMTAEILDKKRKSERRAESREELMCPETLEAYVYGK